MMNKVALLLLGLFFYTDLCAQETKSDSTTEPKSIFEVIMNGKTYYFLEGEEQLLDSLKTQSSLIIRIAPNKKFNNGNISFKYPKYLSFKFEKSNTHKSWVFSGFNFAVSVFEFDVKVPLEDLATETKKKLGKKNCTIDTYQKELGGKMCNVKKITLNIIGESLSLEIFELPSTDSKTRFIYFQEVATQEKPDKSDFDQTFDIISQSIIF